MNFNINMDFMVNVYRPDNKSMEKLLMCTSDMYFYLWKT